MPRCETTCRPSDTSGSEVGPGELLAGVRRRDHDVDGLFVREVSPAPGGRAGSVLAVPGGFHGWWVFERWMPVLAAGGWACYAMSLRGHSDSYPLAEHEWTRLRLADYVADVTAVSRWIDGPVVLLGHSMGGLLAQLAALERPAAALVLVSSVGPGQLGAIRPPLPTDRALRYERQEARALWFHDVDEETFESVWSRLSPESPSVLNEYSDGSVRIEPARIEAPVLAVGGELDATPVHRAERIAGFYGGDYLVVPGVGHTLMYEAGGEGVAQLVVRWLARNSDLRSPFEQALVSPGEVQGRHRTARPPRC